MNMSCGHVTCLDCIITQRRIKVLDKSEPSCCICPAALGHIIVLYPAEKRLATSMDLSNDKIHFTFRANIMFTDDIISLLKMVDQFNNLNILRNNHLDTDSHNQNRKKQNSRPNVVTIEARKNSESACKDIVVNQLDLNSDDPTQNKKKNIKTNLPDTSDRHQYNFKNSSQMDRDDTLEKVLEPEELLNKIYRWKKYVESFHIAYDEGQVTDTEMNELKAKSEIARKYFVEQLGLLGI